MTDISIALAPHVTVINAVTTYYRYDRPAPDELADYLAQLVEADPPECTVTVAGDGAVAVAHALTARGFQSLVDAEPLHDDRLNPDSHPPAPETHPPTDPELAAVADLPIRRPEEPQRTSRFPVVVLAAAVVGVVGAGVWAIASTGSTDQVEMAQHAPAAEELEAAPSSSGPAAAAEPPPVADPPVPAVVELEQDGVTMTLPAGFQLTADGDMWRASGDDPDFRLQLAIDDLFGLPPEQLFRSIENDIADDPELTLVESVPGRVEYLQVAPDGSEVIWVTWVEGGMQLSLGCHSRVAPTTVQRATCDMANDSVDYTRPTDPHTELL